MRVVILAMVVVATWSCEQKKAARPARSEAAPARAPVESDAGAKPEPVDARRTSVDCNAHAWSRESKARTEKAVAVGAWMDRAVVSANGPGALRPDMRVGPDEDADVVVLQNRPRELDPAQLTCWKERAAVEKLSLDPLDRDVAPLLTCAFDGETHAIEMVQRSAPGERMAARPPGDCYAACGRGCKGICQDVAVGCAPPADGATSSAAFACLALSPPGATPKYPWFGEEPAHCVDPRRHANSEAAACAATVHRFAPAGLVATAGRVKICSADECCGHHDECTGAHSNPLKKAFWKCHWYGLRQCGGTWAIAGRPDKVDWTLRAYNTSGKPITGRVDWEWKGVELGSCSWADGKPTWQAPPAQVESYTCAVDDQEH